MSGYQSDRAWSEPFIPEMRRLIGPHLLVPSSLEEDRLQATDLVILRGRDMTIACRIRRPGYAERFPDQFTIRSRRDNGTVTELDKIIDGWGDWLFYGHATGQGVQIAPWWVLNLDAFRSQLIRSKSRTAIRWDDIPNGDGTWLRWFQISSFLPHPPLVVAQSESVVSTLSNDLFSIPAEECR